MKNSYVFLIVFLHLLFTNTIKQVYSYVMWNRWGL